MKSFNYSDPRALLAQQLAQSGGGNISNVGEGIRSATGSLAGAFLQRKVNNDQQAGTEELKNIISQNKGQSPDVLIQAMANSENPYVKERGQQAYMDLMAEQLKPSSPVSVGAGSSLVDPRTGKAIYTAPDSTAAGGATGANIRAYMNDTGKSFSQAWADMYGGGIKGGYSVDPRTGEYIPIPGFNNIVKNKAFNEAGGKIEGETRTKAQLELPKSLDQANYLISQLEALKTSPGREYATGKSSILPTLPGTDAADFQARLDQIGGTQFLQAFESLKGSGQITEIEGEKATNAIARMQRSQTEKGFLDAVNEFQGIVSRAAERARMNAGSVPTSNAPVIPTGGNIGANVNQAPSVSKNIGGKNYVQINGQWYEQ